MKKPFNTKKLSNPSKILRRVLSKTSNTSEVRIKKQDTKMENDKKNAEIFMKPTINVEAELLLLKQQVNGVQTALTNMQNETEKKEIAIANLAREKERLACDLRKQQRTNNSLKQQLDEEREFYYKEKELYCQEMNDCKKLKKSIKHGDQKSQLEHYKKEVVKLKDSLTQTLEANYNLSVKFLRMKNTKYCIKNRLRKLETIHENAIGQFHTQIEHLKSELSDIVDRELQVPIPPSNKKYLQIIKQNGALTHENLCLRLEVDRLSLEVERLKMQEIQNDTNNKLKYINHKNKETRTIIEKKIKEEKVNRNKIKSKEEQLILFSHEDNLNEKNFRKESEMSIRKIFETEIKCVLPNVTLLPSPNVKEVKISEEFIGEKEMNFDLIELSDKPSETLTNDSDFTHCYNPVRTQSAPEIVQTTLFLNDNDT